MSTHATSLPPKPLSPRALRLLPWVGAALLLLGALLAATLLLRARAQPLPRLGALPAFSFTRESGQPFGLEQLRGRPWVANFIFTRCPTVCPAFTRKMAQVQQRTGALGEQLALVSFSVDPQYDTPERLAEYAARHGADTRRWSFLTGDYQQLQDTVVNGFKVSMGRDSPDEQDVLGIFHGTHFVLVDRQGEIRGYYDSADEAAVERLLGDVQQLVRSGE